jgi:large subunit ribosomal protein L13
MRKIEIDAKGKRIGRVASDAAKFLIGKDSVFFERNKTADVEVLISNASKTDVSDRKLETKKYRRFSGYPSGLKEEKMANLVKRKGYKEAVRKAVYGMLPINKLRDRRMKQLFVEE